MAWGGHPVEGYQCLEVDDNPGMSNANVNQYIKFEQSQVLLIPFQYKIPFPLNAKQ